MDLKLLHRGLRDGPCPFRCLLRSSHKARTHTQTQQTHILIVGKKEKEGSIHVWLLWLHGWVQCFTWWISSGTKSPMRAWYFTSNRYPLFYFNVILDFTVSSAGSRKHLSTSTRNVTTVDMIIWKSECNGFIQITGKDQLRDSFSSY